MLKQLLLIATTFVLMACQQAADMPATPKVDWLIDSGKLVYFNQPVNWDKSEIANCNSCSIEKSQRLLPSGPITRYVIKQSGAWRGVKQHEHIPFISVVHHDKSIRVPVIFDSQTQQLSLQLPKQSLAIKLRTTVSFLIEDTEYQLWVEEFKVAQQPKHYSDERSGHEIKYLLLKVN
ncbi:hypothetical protein [Aliikangiella sp. IMCC44359]|uniref:hypothetical protein n=1 Tax=Aliikangiella sp. IMCC44359 TaxID=3459125 RepID=UPI00403B2EAA